MLKPKAPPRQTRESIRAALVASCRTQTAAVMATPDSFKASAPLPAKLSRKDRTDNAITASANGEECHMRLDGVCNGRAETTVWSHWPGLAGDRGMGIKSLDAGGCYTCSACHDAIDQRATLPAGMTRTDAVLAWMFGHLRSLVTLARKGLL